MYLWTITLLEKWTFLKSYEDGDETDYCIASKTGEAAIEKAKKLANRSIVDDETGKTESIKSVSLIGLKRGNWIDG